MTQQSLAKKDEERRRIINNSSNNNNNIHEANQGDVENGNSNRVQRTNHADQQHQARSADRPAANEEDNLHGSQIRELQTVIRDKDTTRGNFKFYADRLIRLVVEEGLNGLPTEAIEVQTPTGHTFAGIRYLKGNCGVSIVRSGESMEQGLRDCCRSIRIGKILIESEDKNQARVLYTKFPRDIAERKILLLYPIMSTGLAVIESVKVLLGYGCREENLILLNLFSSPRAAKMINGTFPKMFALTSDINLVCPNHFGQRYFGTD